MLMQPATKPVIIRVLDGARNTSASGSRARKNRGFFVSPILSGVCRNTILAREIRQAVLQRFLAPDNLETLQGGTKMRATKSKPTFTLKPKIQIISGALSLYRAVVRPNDAKRVERGAS
jgi:hypothetical protein